MKISVAKINSITPIFVGGGNPSQLKINVELEDYNAEKLFYQIWESYEGGLFEKWIEAEGYSLVKRTPAGVPPVAQIKCTACNGTGQFELPNGEPRLCGCMNGGPLPKRI